MKMQNASCKNRKQTSATNRFAILAALFWILAMSTSTWAQTGQAGILEGTSPDGGTVRIVIKLKDGTFHRFEVTVAKGAKSAEVMAALAIKIDGDPNFSALATDFTIGSGADKKTVNSVKITSLDGAIDTIRVRPDDSGFKDYDSDSGTSNKHSYLLLPHGPVLPGQVEFTAIVGDSSSVFADATALVPNGTSVNAILGDLSSQLTTEGVTNQVSGDMLTVDTVAGQTFLVGGYAFSQGLTNIAYDQTIVGGHATPEPASLFLLGSGIAGFAGVLRRRLLPRT